MKKLLSVTIVFALSASMPVFADPPNKEEREAHKKHMEYEREGEKKYRESEREYAKNQREAERETRKHYEEAEREDRKHYEEMAREERKHREEMARERAKEHDELYRERGERISEGLAGHDGYGYRGSAEVRSDEEVLRDIAKDKAVESSGVKPGSPEEALIRIGTDVLIDRTTISPSSEY